ncbi:MAG: Arginine--tRNA ligase [bacterium ADurb.Bin400]|nr:MAG: Arginine--tRNA ligase [bacterium ADurb.Bin400]
MVYEVVRKEVAEAVDRAGYQMPANIKIDEPPRPEMGDFATNVAMLIGREYGIHPTEAAGKIADQLRKFSEIEEVEVAGPGFLNIFLSDDFYLNGLRDVLDQAEEYGHSLIGKGQKVNVEYISANPTGPLHVGNARGGPIGEALANLFSFLGYQVDREFYVNDIGGQVDRFAESLYYWYAVKEDSRVSFPEGGYPGEYIKEISEEIQKSKAKELAQLRQMEDIVEFFKLEGLARIVSQIREDSGLLGITFDNWIYQSEFEISGESQDVVTKLKDIGATVNKEGALWFKRPDDPDLADRESVLRKSDETGTLTYFADDIAYHKDKYEREYDLLIDVWGANHHGHVPRLNAAVSVLGYSPDKLRIVLYQYVRLKRGGEVVKMGKRFGNFVTLREIIEEGVTADAFKYFILTQNPDTPMDFDLQLAKDTSEKNPVFYIKYAHARICSILRKASEQGQDSLSQPDLTLLAANKEKMLYKELIKFPELLSNVALDFQIQAIAHYAYRIAGLFHDFYTECQVLGEDQKLTAARLALTRSTKYVLANALKILDIEAPEKM